MKDKDKKKDKDKLVTVAIHTFQKAQILKNILESEGIDTYIHNVNLLQPMISAGVRVRINEIDLPRALDIIENIKFDDSEIGKVETKKIKNEILVPVDFSEFTLRTCEFAFWLAKEVNCNVKLMHVYFSSFYPTSIPFGDTFTAQPTVGGMYKDVHESVERDMKDLVSKLNNKIADGIIPDIDYSYTLREGLPEEEVVSYSKKVRPHAIVMGTRGSNKKEQDLIGSVTAEVIDGCKTPIFAIPENSDLCNISSLKNVVFLTNFQEREFLAIATLMEFIKAYPIKVSFVHVARKEDKWNEMKLTGLNNYFKEHYPNVQTDYTIIDGNEGIPEALEKFVNENTIDMISLSSSPRNIFARMFNPGIARRMLFHTNTPMLVIKSSSN
ncbi:MAG: universal stress protein [Dysgonamonadaceae bacterium]|nr:universal stress protein [Dysgonamonadaceae bacterium]MDD4727378.1 universal stress protein [Dysgonamonadaceae bacterium]